MPHIIRIQRRDVLPSGICDGQIPGGGNTTIFLAKEPDTRVLFRGGSCNVPRVVVRPIVYNDDLNVPMCLSKCSRNCRT
jgi:hypothetical protein